MESSEAVRMEMKLMDDSFWDPGMLPEVTAASLSEYAAATCPWAFIVVGFGRRTASNAQGGIIVDQFKRNDNTPHWARVKDEFFTLQTMYLIFERLCRYVFLFIL